MLKVIAAAVAATAALTLAAPAQAITGSYITATVSWGPTACVEVHEPDPSTGRTTYATGTACGNGFLQVSYFAPVGTLVGIDPVMGANSTVSCSIVASGRLLYSDYGTAGDGHDITCLRTLTGGDTIA